MDDSRASRPDGRLVAVPPYLVVLALAAVAGIVLMHRAPGIWTEAAGNYTAEVRRHVVFALVFNGGLAAALAAVAVGETVATVVRFARKAPARPVLGRFAAAVGLLIAFGAAHVVVNPWLGDLVRALRSLG